MCNLYCFFTAKGLHERRLASCYIYTACFVSFPFSVFWVKIVLIVLLCLVEFHIFSGDPCSSGMYSQCFLYGSVALFMF
jgi:hypothetical protein